MKFIFTLAGLCAVWSIAGCTSIFPHYELQSGQWVYVHWNESAGTVIDPVSTADAPSFRMLGSSEYAVDKNAVYFQARKITGANPASFHNIRGNYWADEGHVYFVNHEILGANPQTFVPLAILPWSRDQDSAYRAEEQVPSSDPKTFSAINFYWAKDSTHFYAYGFNKIAIVDCDYASMKILNSDSKMAPYAKDNSHAYWLGTIIAGADVNTFVVINKTMAKDKFRRYSGPTEYWFDKKNREQKAPNP